MNTNAALDALFPNNEDSGIRGAINWTFDCMETAERLIKLHCSENLAKEAFQYVMPSEPLRGKMRLYEAHVVELLTRLKKSKRHEKVTEPGTDAEILAVLLAGSLKAPLDTNHQAVAERLFAKIFPRDAAKIFASGGRARESHAGACDEIIEALRKKLTVKRSVRT